MSEIGYSNEVVVRRVLDGDNEAFGLLFDKYSDLVFSIAFHYTRNRRNAMDIAQDVFLEAYSSLGEIRDLGKFDKWLSRIAISKSLNFLRRTPLEPVAIGDSRDLSNVALFDRQDKKLPPAVIKKVWAAVDKLREDYRNIVMLKYFDGLSYEKIASVLGVNVCCVRSRLTRAKKALRALLASQIEQTPASAPSSPGRDAAATA